MMSYLDDFADPNHMPLYLSLMVSLTHLAIPVLLGMLLASFCLKIPVDFYRLPEGFEVHMDQTGMDQMATIIFIHLH